MFSRSSSSLWDRSTTSAVVDWGFRHRNYSIYSADAFRDAISCSWNIGHDESKCTPLSVRSVVVYPCSLGAIPRRIWRGIRGMLSTTRLLSLHQPRYHVSWVPDLYWYTTLIMFTNIVRQKPSTLFLRPLISPFARTCHKYLASWHRSPEGRNLVMTRRVMFLSMTLLGTQWSNSQVGLYKVCTIGGTLLVYAISLLLSCWCSRRWGTFPCAWVPGCDFPTQSHLHHAERGIFHARSVISTSRIPGQFPFVLHVFTVSLSCW